MADQLDYLDALALRVAKGDLDCVGALSRGEYLYVALAANSAELLNQSNDTIAEALARLGPEWTAALIERWQYKGNPARY
ncbi:MULTISPECIES: hypothetical protein [Pseudomonadaceae]|jgi:hypothetical protein|uniref:Uncharacterized protein n=5 Tax=Pseudomonadaceae TaxID=135621 RepID=A0A220ITF2_PSEFL|nr:MULTISPECIES: hypothetical protein [Pseudomonadaceae]AZP73757.1 hypothetical protein EJJ20_35620 [Pseudomonas poae]EES7561531.1 hypothetical protein [Escherichia coli]MBT9571899.1 hypothetical protein [Pseudomonas umsongensis]OHC62142.1 MAG: hypothetical protein A3J25_03720 [Pseudomonadales bacterium RIFCSPLOWO2_02_FULL_63_210]HDS0958835.1 hypothetical protein [Pseudomonas putida]